MLSLRVLRMQLTSSGTGNTSCQQCQPKKIVIQNLGDRQFCISIESSHLPKWSKNHKNTPNI